MAFADKVKPVVISGKEVLPIVEGGKGIGATSGQSSAGMKRSQLKAGAPVRSPSYSSGWR